MLKAFGIIHSIATRQTKEAPGKSPVALHGIGFTAPIPCAAAYSAEDELILESRI